MPTDKAKILKHFQKADPKLAKIINKINFDDWFNDRGADPNSIFTSLCQTIIGQQLANKAASAIFSRFQDLFATGITPQSVLAANQDTIRAAGLSWAKVKSVVDLSQKIINGQLKLQDLNKLSDEDLIAHLTQVKGIGRWTAEMFLMFSMSRPDIFSWGDLGLKKGLLKFVNLQSPTPLQLEKVVNSWSPYRTYAAIAMWHLTDN